MGDVADFIEWPLGLWLFALIALTVLRMATGSINLNGLFRLDAKAPFGLERVQLAAVTMLFAAGYAVASLYRSPGPKASLPDVPMPLLLILLGSNGTYLAVKYSKYSALRRETGGK